MEWNPRDLQRHWNYFTDLPSLLDMLATSLGVVHVRVRMCGGGNGGIVYPTSRDVIQGYGEVIGALWTATYVGNDVTVLVVAPGWYF